MAAHKILFLPSDIEISVHDGSNLIRAAINNGIHINASCGWKGVCGKCRVIIEEGNVQGGVDEKLSSYDLKNNYRLACKSVVIEDIVVRVPEGSVVDFGETKFNVASTGTVKIEQVDLNYLRCGDFFKPIVGKFFLNLPEPNASDRLSDVDRIAEYFRVHFGEKYLQLNLQVVRKIPDMIRSNNYSVTATLLMPVKEISDKKESNIQRGNIINVQPGDTTDQNFAIAMDLGTTNVCGQLIDLKTGNAIAEYGSVNKQVIYGEDVITRIIFAEKNNGLSEINEVLIDTINGVIIELVKCSGVDAENVSMIVFAGNTTMTQLFLKINPKYIRISPYIPCTNFYPAISAIDLGISLNDYASILIYPAISSYVGGDIVAGVVASKMYLSEKLTLFIDLGTNAEIVIGNKDLLVCAACSAGPAFEGGGIEFGIRAIPGAIEGFSIDPVSFEPVITTIGNISPKGICGSGLITIVAVMFEMGVIDNRGKFNLELGVHRIRKRNGSYEYILAWANETQIGRDIVISEIDIDNLIRAKGAIFSGCLSLLNELGMTMDNLDRIILAGGFGSYINLQNAMTIGLLPEIDSSKVTFIGNSSLLGARMYFLNDDIRQDVVNVVRKMTNCELSETQSYMDNYIASLFLPHTDIEMFPKLKQKLKKIRKKDNVN